MPIPRNEQAPVRLGGIDAGYDGATVLHQLDLVVEAGERVVLLGPNGAGKTTLFRCILGLVRPSSGTVSLFGRDPSDESARRDLLLRVGTSLEAPGLPAQTRPLEYLEHFARLCGLPHPVDAARRALRLWELPEDVDAQRMSLGQRQRLQVARSLLHVPRLAMLDEPAANLDPSAQEAFWSLLDRWQDATGSTLVVSTHHLEEAYRHGPRWVLMGDGRILADGSPRNILAAVRASRRLRLAVSIEGRRLEAVLHLRDSRIEILGDRDRTDSQWRILAPTGNFDQVAILKTLVDAGLPVVSYGEDGTTLEESYRCLLGKRAPERGAQPAIEVRSFEAVPPTLAEVVRSAARLHFAGLSRERRMLVPLFFLVGLLTFSVLFALPDQPPGGDAYLSLLALAALLPAGLSGGIAADLVAGERERRSLETFLCAPASPAALVLGRALAILAPGLALSWASIAVTWIALASRSLAPSPAASLCLAAAFAPGAIVLAVATGAWVSTRSRTVRAAAQLSALVTIPLVVLAQATPALTPPSWSAGAGWLASGTLLALAGAPLAWSLKRMLSPRALLR